MTAISSSLQKAEDGLPLVQRASLAQLAGARKYLTRTEFDAAVSAERQRITDNGIGLYATGEELQIIGELGYRSWFAAATGTNAEKAAASHARTVIITPSVAFVLAGDANVATATTDVPTAGGADNDIAVNTVTGTIFKKVSGTWQLGGMFSPPRESRTSRLLSAWRTARFANPRTLGTLASAPTVTLLSSMPGGITKGYAFNATGAFSITGGVAVSSVADTAYRIGAATMTSGGNVGGTRMNSGWRIKMVVDAVAPVFRFVNSTAKVRFLAAGPQGMQYVSLTPTAITNASATNYVQLDFTAAGGRAAREIWIEGEKDVAFMSATVGPTESVVAAPLSGTVAVLLGDSLANGTSAAFQGDSFGMVLADYLGIGNVLLSGVPSQGYVAVAGGYTTPARARLDAVPADVFFIALGSNDIGTATGTLVPAALDLVTYLRRTYPTAFVCLFGTPSGATGPSTTVIAQENAINGAVEALGDPFVISIRHATAATPILFGTGHVGATAGNGNADIYVNSADVTHWTDAGHAFIGKTYADRFAGALASLAFA